MHIDEYKLIQKEIDCIVKFLKYSQKEIFENAYR